jgi:hypothetical protein
VVCAIAPGPPSRASNAIVVIKFRMIGLLILPRAPPLNGFWDLVLVQGWFCGIPDAASEDHLRRLWPRAYLLPAGRCCLDGASAPCWFLHGRL